MAEGDRSEWKLGLWRDLERLNVHGGLLRKIFDQAENTTGVSVQVLSGKVERLQKEMEGLHVCIGEKDKHIDDLIQCIDELKNPTDLRSEERRVGKEC